jgi:ATP-binding cassette subfamily F protein uup
MYLFVSKAYVNCKQFYLCTPMAARNVLSVDKITKFFGERRLFESISLGLAEGEKVALIAKNGVGKSTLMRLLAGREVPDEGTITLRDGIRIGMLDQEMNFNPDLTLLEALMAGDLPILEVIHTYEKALRKEDSEAFTIGHGRNGQATCMGP